MSSNNATYSLAGAGRVGMRVWVYHPSSQSGWRGDTPTHAYSFPPGGEGTV